VDPSAPQDLVGEEVPDPRDERLVHQRGLDPSAASIEAHDELLPVQAERVRTEVAEERLDLFGRRGQPGPPSLRMFRYRISPVSRTRITRSCR
jgi:hypothetical protein